MARHQRVVVGEERAKLVRAPRELEEVVTYEARPLLGREAPGGLSSGRVPRSASG